MPIVQILESHPEESNLWVREVLCIRIMGRTIPWSSRLQQMEFVYELDESTPDLHELRDKYLDVWETERAWLVFRATDLVTPIGKPIGEIAILHQLNFAGIYIDHEHLDVFVCNR